MTLNQTEIRILGALIEKEIATPENYPLSLNALVAACNQKSSRDPVMNLTEEEVRQSLHSLDDMGLTSVVRDSRVAKYEHRIRTVLNLRRDETAILCLLFLRGPQTPGELRGRADRLYSFDGLEGVESTLARMMSVPDHEPQANEDLRPLVAVLPRQPGSREARYVHLLGGPFEAGSQSTDQSMRTEARDEDANATLAGRVSILEAEVASLRTALERIETRIGANVSDLEPTSD